MTGVWRFGRGLAIGLCLLTGPSAPAGENPGPREVVQETVDEVLAVLRQPGLSEAERRARIETIAYARFDFAAMSMSVLGKSRRRFSPAQQQAFVEEFREFLSRSYGRRINRYEQEKVEVTGERVGTRGDVTVKTRILGGQADGIVIQYRLRQGKQDGAWKVIDVKVEGTSLASNYRAQFGEVLAGGTPDDLLAWLRKKNAAPGDEEEPARDAAANAGS